MPTESQVHFPFADEALATPLAVVRLAVDWAGGIPTGSLSAAEREMLGKALGGSSPVCEPVALDGQREADPFGELLVGCRPLEERRRLGQFLTPDAIVDVMVDWVKEQEPRQVVDAGCGTGRFAVAAACAMPNARVLAVDSDPVAALLCRARAKQLGLRNLHVCCADFLADPLPLETCRTAFVGNPPYVRHHALSRGVKQWGARVSRELGVPFSGLAGLHTYFFLSTARRSRRGDVGCYITSAEWLDVGYGKGLRRLLASRLGVLSVSVLSESSRAFEDAMTTAAITCFRVGRRVRSARFSAVEEFRKADGRPGTRSVKAEQLGQRWGAFVRANHRRLAAADCTRLGSLVAVHRGVATGANRFFVMDAEEAEELGLGAFARPVVTSGKHVLGAGGVLRCAGARVLLLLPRDLRDLPPHERDAVQQHLKRGEREGIPGRYLCRQRRPWWWLGELRPPPIVASYMARRPPAFALNPDAMFILNIAHGLYPKQPMPKRARTALVRTLNATAADFVGSGRRYHGGLEKFEPREMENLLIPSDWLENGR